MPYCSAADLLVGDMTVSAQRAEPFINAASDEVDMRLGTMFVLPLPEEAELEPVVRLVLKQITTKLATGRLLMAQAVGSEDTATHAYGTFLLREGQALLDSVLRGDTLLPGLELLPGLAGKGNQPSIVNEDTASAVDTFYGFAWRGEYGNQWLPGV